MMRSTISLKAILLFAAGSLLASGAALAQSIVAVPVVAHLSEGTTLSDLPHAWTKAPGKRIDMIDPDLLQTSGSIPLTFEQELVLNLETDGIVVKNEAQGAGKKADPKVEAQPELSSAKAVAVSANSVSLLDEHKVYVKVQYEHRPVGGILTVRVSMTPTFRGVGVATRPTTSRSTALAVDELTDEMVKTLVHDLTEEIKTEFQKMEADGLDTGGTDK